MRKDRRERRLSPEVEPSLEEPPSASTSERAEKEKQEIGDTRYQQKLNAVLLCLVGLREAEGETVSHLRGPATVQRVEVGEEPEVRRQRDEEARRQRDEEARRQREEEARSQRPPSRARISKKFKDILRKLSELFRTFYKAQLLC